MDILTSDFPGAHERHVLRKHNNPLFPRPLRLDDQTLFEAQRRDFEARQAFQRDFEALLEEAVNLEQNVDTDTLLRLKGRLDEAYETACFVSGDQTAIKQAIQKLIAAIMNTLWQHIEPGDALAQAELRQEEMARQQHFRLLETPLIADLLSPHSPIAPDELAPTLLSADDDELRTALALFDETQLSLLVSQAKALLAPFEQRPDCPPEAWRRLEIMERALQRPGSPAT